MRLKVTLAMIAAFFALMLTSCSYNLGIETLMRPPKLTEEQSEIYTALQQSAGSGLKLKYPRSGDYRSAFVIVNIDDEPTEEALVFYETESPQAGESALRINVLDQQDGKWRSVYDLAGAGTDVERVEFSMLGESEEIHIIVGFAMLNQAERTMRVYTYANAGLYNVYDDTYTIFEILDFDANGENELLILNNSNTVDKPYARVIEREEYEFHVADQVPMEENAQEYTAVIEGQFGNRVALYVDGTRGNSQLGTEVLSYQNGYLRNLTYNTTQNLVENTLRATELAAVDIDYDGVIEIPATAPFPGYEELTRSEQLLATLWYTVDSDELVRKYYSYYNISDGYVFMFPQRWQGQNVTVKMDAQSGELIFYKYEGALDDDMVELMRLREKEEDFDEIDNLIAQGYEEIPTVDYMVKIAQDWKEPLIPTMSEISFSFMLIY